MSLALSICVFFILFMQLINGVQFLNVIPLSLSSAYLAATNCASVLPADGSASRITAIFLIKSINASLYTHKLNFHINVLIVI